MLESVKITVSDLPNSVLVGAAAMVIMQQERADHETH